jgi:hypothetical protein
MNFNDNAASEVSQTIKDEPIIYARRLFSLMPPSEVAEIKSKIIKEGS